jgi:hypothetical protein
MDEPAGGDGDDLRPATIDGAAHPPDSHRRGLRCQGHTTAHRYVMLDGGSSSDAEQRGAARIADSL